MQKTISIHRYTCIYKTITIQRSQLKSDLLHETARATAAEHQEIDRAMLAEDVLQKHIRSATLNSSKQDEIILSIIANQSIANLEARTELNQSYEENRNQLHDVENLLQRIVATLRAHNISMVELNSSLLGIKSDKGDSVSKTVLSNIPQDHLVYILAMLFLFNAGNISYSIYLRYLLEANKNIMKRGDTIKNNIYRVMDIIHQPTNL